MKQLSIEEKARRYDEAFRRAKEKYVEFEGMKQGDVLENVFPELKESEDERIRKELIEFVKSRGGFKQEYIIWLERQGEQKPVWSEEDEKMLANIICSVNACDALDGTISISLEKHEKKISWLKSLKERYTWKPSDEQIKVCKEVYADILSAKGFDLGTVNGELNRLEEELKKLREA